MYKVSVDELTSRARELRSRFACGLLYAVLDGARRSVSEVQLVRMSCVPYWVASPQMLQCHQNGSPTLPKANPDMDGGRSR